MNSREFSEIFLFVHPGWHVINSYLKRISMKKPDETTRLEKQEIALLNSQFSGYGKVILESAKKPERLVVVLNPELIHKMFGLMRQRISSKSTIKDINFIEGKLSRFIEFAKSNLRSEQFLELKEDINLSAELVRSKNLAGKVKLTALGEWKEQSVKKNVLHLVSALKTKGIKVNALEHELVFSKNTPLRKIKTGKKNNFHSPKKRI